jgi:hypothetical protein
MILSCHIKLHLVIIVWENHHNLNYLQESNDIHIFRVNFVLKNGSVCLEIQYRIIIGQINGNKYLGSRFSSSTLVSMSNQVDVSKILPKIFQCPNSFIREPKVPFSSSPWFAISHPWAFAYAVTSPEMCFSIILAF